MTPTEQIEVVARALKDALDRQNVRMEPFICRDGCGVTIYNSPMVNLTALARAAIESLQSTNPSLVGQVEELREALEPFADIADQIAYIERETRDDPSPDHMLRLVPMRHLRKARAVLKGGEG